MTVSRRSLVRRRTEQQHRQLPTIDILAIVFIIVEVCYVSVRIGVEPCLKSSRTRLQVPPSTKCPSLDKTFVAAPSEVATVNVPSRSYRRKKLSCPSFPVKSWRDLQNKPALNSSSGVMYLSLVHSDDDVVGSVALQMAPPACPVRMATMRQTAYTMNYESRNVAESFLFTFVRSPTERAIRDFFHHMITVRRWEPSDPTFMQFLEERDYRNRNLQELSLNEPYQSGVHNETAVVESILGGYDFIGVSERRDESLVVMKLLLKLTTSQILYLNNPTPFVMAEERCNLIMKPFVSPKMRQYFESDADWQNRIRGDALLHQAANRSLDRTIEALGRSVVERELKQFREALELAREICEDEVLFRCNLNGMMQRGRDKCVYGRYGCANYCLASKKVVDKLDKGQQLRG